MNIDVTIQSSTSYRVI